MISCVSGLLFFFFNFSVLMAISVSGPKGYRIGAADQETSWKLICAFRFEHPESHGCKFWKRNLLLSGVLKCYSASKRYSTEAYEFYLKEIRKAYILLNTEVSTEKRDLERNQTQGVLVLPVLDKTKIITSKALYE